MNMYPQRFSWGFSSDEIMNCQNNRQENRQKLSISFEYKHIPIYLF